jgi:5-methyltetrahydrofolate--homocysteine methyltransferase
MTQDYADEIGADAYCNDAMETVHYANKVFHVEE